MIKTILLVVLVVLCAGYVLADHHDYEELARLAQSLTDLERRIQGKDLQLDRGVSQVLGMILSVVNQDLAEYVAKASAYNARRPSADNPLRPYLWLRNRLAPLPPPFASPLDEAVQ